MQKAKLQVELVTDQTVKRLCRKLAHQIQDSGYQPDIIIAIARGGYIPARLLCDHLDIYNLTSIRIAHYTGADKGEQARLSFPLGVNVEAMQVLLVDDVDDTGDTLHLAIDHIKQQNPLALKVAVLHHKIVSSVVPDYYAKKLIRWRWITYPWAIIEDLLGFVRKIRPTPPDIDQAIKQIEKDYGIKVSKQIMQDVYRLL